MNDWNEWAALAREINQDLRRGRPDISAIEAIGLAMNQAEDTLEELRRFAAEWDAAAAALRRAQEGQR